MSTDEFNPPNSLEEGEERLQELTEDVQNIQFQLGDKQRTDEEGHRLPNDEYWTWRNKARHALNKKLVELRTMKT